MKKIIALLTPLVLWLLIVLAGTAEGQFRGDRPTLKEFLDSIKAKSAIVYYGDSMFIYTGVTVDTILIAEMIHDTSASWAEILRGDAADSARVIVGDSLVEVWTAIFEEQDSTTSMAPRLLVAEDSIASAAPRLLIVEDSVLSIAPRLLIEEDSTKSMAPRLLITEDSIISIAPRLLIVEDSVLSIAPRLLIVEDSVISIAPRVLVLEDSVLSLAPRLLIVEDSITVIAPRMLTAEGDITALETAIDSANTNIADNVGAIGGLVSAVDSINLNVTDHKAKLDSLELQGIRIALDTLPQPNLMSTGFYLWGVAGDTTSPGLAYKVTDVQNTWARADTSVSVRAAGAAMDSVNLGAVCRFLVFGTFRKDAWDWTPGAAIFSDSANAGEVGVGGQATPKKMQFYGTALSADVIFFNFDATIVH